MANPTGFIEFPRIEVEYRPVSDRVKDFCEVDRPMSLRVLTQQAARCMDCGIPFCHEAGCPLQNRMPEFQELVYRGRWRDAVDNLHSTNNFPEITGRVCPAPCEAACTLALHNEPVTIKHIEYQVAQRALAEGWIEPKRPPHPTRYKIAVVGSGPAGLAAAQQLARLGHQVVVFEKEDRIGGLLRYGIPDFKLEKQIIDIRLEQMGAEGVKFETDVTVGEDISVRYLRKMFDAICLCMGAGEPRKLAVPGAGYEGVHFAMDYLTQQNRRIAGDREPSAEQVIDARGKHVIVIGGGDTGSDCVGTSIRQGAASVTQLEILPKPPDGYNPDTLWPEWPRILRTSSSQEEGCQRRWSASTRELIGTGMRVSHLHGCEVDWVEGSHGWAMKERPGTEFTIPAELVLLAMGFVHATHSGLIKGLNLELDPRGNVVVDNWGTSQSGIYAAGDTVRGASLVVHAIAQGRKAAAAIHAQLG